MDVTDVKPRLIFFVALVAPASSAKLATAVLCGDRNPV